MPQNVQQHHPCMAVADVFSSLICIRQITPLDAIVISWVVLTSFVMDLPFAKK
jgi:hypothetical protein